MESLLHNPLAMYVAFWVLSALFSTMPAPRADSSIGYTWLYNIGQFVSANISKIKTAACPTPKPPDPPAAKGQGA